MKNMKWLVWGALALAAVAMVGGGAEAREGRRSARRSNSAWRQNFTIDPARLSDFGRNDYFILEPGHRIVLREEDEGKISEVIITVLDETREVTGVRTRVIEERETVDGHLIEVSKNYFAIDRVTKDVYYFGEAVTKYRRDGTAYNASDAWLAGENGARAGLVMPGTVRVGDKYYQEQAPRVAMDRSEVVSLTESVTTPSGVIENCLKIVETTPLEPREHSYKFYARGIGMIGDGDIRLVEHGMTR